MADSNSLDSIATNTAMLTLDSLSLLLSKQNPTQASATLSKHLREIVGIGTLGADRLEDSNLTSAKEKDQEEVAQGLTIIEINNTRDSATSATEFLQREVELEGKYWEEIIGVQKSGWAVCKMTHDKRLLGVRFGFPEGKCVSQHHPPKTRLTNVCQPHLNSGAMVWPL